MSLILSAFLSVAAAQTTFTGCHMLGSVSFCYDSNGVETPMTTLAEVVSTSSTPVSVTASTTAEAQTTAITSCHLHATDLFCIDGEGAEVSVSLTGTATSPPPAEFTDCHAHGTEQFCVAPDGSDVAVLSTSEVGHNNSEEGEAGMDCHFHAGVE